MRRLLRRLRDFVLSRTDFARAWVSSVVAAAISLSVAQFVLQPLGITVAANGLAAAVIPVMVVYPLYTALYVVWGVASYRRMAPDRLRQTAAHERTEGRSAWNRFWGLTSVGDVTITAALTAVIVTIVIAQTPQFREQNLFLVLGLLTVASSWVLMVFSFSQSYVRLAARTEGDVAIRFPFTEEPRFGDYLTLAVLMSTMAATVSAEFTARAGWRLARINVLVAFAFNSVIIAMMVSLLFGGLGG